MESVPRIGQLVFSRAGRDTGRPMVVVSVCDRRHVLVIDGTLHPGARPKRKNVRHLGSGSGMHPVVSAGGPVTDAQIRSWLLEMTAAEGGRALEPGVKEGQA